MTIKTGKPDSETYQRKVRTGVHAQKSGRGGGRGMVISTLVAGAAVLMLAAAPTAFAAAGIAPGFSGDGTPHPASPTKSTDAPASTPTPTMSGDMPGMEHGSGEAPASTPTPTMSGEMPGMEHGSGEAPASTPTPPMSGDMPGMEHGSGDTAEPDHGTGTTEGNHGAGEAAAEPDRPLAAVLGTFGGGTAAVMVTAGFLRKKDRAADQVKAAARIARRSQK